MARIGFRVVGAIAGMLFATSARGAEPTDADQARAAELVQAGTTAAMGKRWDACVTSLSEAAAIDGAPTTAGELGVCEEHAGKIIEAYDHLRRAMDAAPAPPRGEPWASYQAALARITQRVGVVWVTVYPREAYVLLDGRPLGRADGRSFAVAPGRHTIAARLPGYEDAAQPVSVRGGDVPHMHLTLTPKPAPLEPPALLPPPGSVAPMVTAAGSGFSSAPERVPVLWYQPAWSPRGVLVTLTYASLAAAVTSGATALALEVDRASLRNKVTSTDCGASSPSPRQACGPLAERAGQADSAAWVALGALIATGVFSGASLVAFGYEREGQNSAAREGHHRPTVVPMASLNGGGVFILGSW